MENNNLPTQSKLWEMNYNNSNLVMAFIMYPNQDTKFLISLLLMQTSSKVVAPRTGNFCYTYDRVTSRDQMINGNSLTWQFERLDEHAEKCNLQIKNRYGGTYESAKNDERKEFKKDARGY